MIKKFLKNKLLLVVLSSSLLFTNVSTMVYAESEKYWDSDGNVHQEVTKGALLSPYDSSGLKLNDLVSGNIHIPKSFRRDDEKFRNGIAIKNQGSISSCVAHALATSREITEYEQTKYLQAFSASFIYGNRAAHHSQKEGMHVDQALSMLMKDGVCPYQYFYNHNVTYSEIKEKKLITDAARTAAKPHRISGYARIYSVSEIQQALMQLGPVPFRMDTYCGGSKIPMSNNVLVKPAPGSKKSDSGHAMVIVGWTEDNKFIVQNSWGKTWGDHGYFYIPFDLIRCNEFRFQFWAILDAIIPNTEKFIDKADDGEPIVKMWNETLLGYKNNMPNYKTEYKWVRLSQIENNIMKGFHLCRQVTISDIRTLAELRTSYDSNSDEVTLFKHDKTGELKWLYTKYCNWDIQRKEFKDVIWIQVNPGKDVYNIESLCLSILVDWDMLENAPV